MSESKKDVRDVKKGEKSKKPLKCR